LEVGPKALKSISNALEKQQLFYFDVVSLYPTVNALDYYPIGFGRYVKTTPEDILSGKVLWYS
jgi:hypothetical protein